MKAKPLVSVTIPTYNSARTLEKTLISLRGQNYNNIEINIVDKNSKDNTVKIAKKYKCRILNNDGSLLESRYDGVKHSKGKYVLILDSDQILAKDVISRAVQKCEIEKCDMLALEEFSKSKNTFLEKLFDLDRQVINKVNNLNPFTGVIMPRFFKRNLLLSAYGNIPKKIFPNTGGPDHAIVYYECWKITKEIGNLSHAVEHIEPSTFKEFLPKFFRWGYTSVDAHFGRYSNLMSQKERFRTGLFTKGLIIESLGSILLLVFKGIAFKSGFYLGKIDKLLDNKRRY